MNMVTYRRRHAKHGFMKGAIVLASVLALLGVSQSLADGWHSRFSERSVRGCYVEALAGTVLPDAKNPAVQLPIASLIRFCADGQGKAWVSATQNIAGSCIVEQEGEATYQVERSGTGSVTAILQNGNVSPGCEYVNPPIGSGESATFTLRFAIQRLGGCLQTIGLGLVPESGTPIGYVAQGEACPQW